MTAFWQWLPRLAILVELLGQLVELLRPFLGV